MSVSIFQGMPGGNGWERLMSEGQGVGLNCYWTKLGLIWMQLGIALRQGQSFLLMWRFAGTNGM